MSDIGELNSLQMRESYGIRKACRSAHSSLQAGLQSRLLILECSMRFLPLVLLGLGCLPVLAMASTPEDAAQAFYTARLASESMGAPGGMELAEFSTYLGPELVCLLGAARRYNDAHLATHPGQVPPFSHGDIYSGGEDHPTRFTLGKARINGQRATLSAQFEFQTEDGQSVQREDTLHMLLSKRHWVINDIEYGEAPSFALPKKALVEGLREALGQASPELGWDAKQLDGCPVDGELAKLKAAQQRKEAKASASKKKGAKGAKPTHGKKKAGVASRSSSKATAGKKSAAASTAKKKTNSSSKRRVPAK
jgi:hypothetical protein